MSYVVKYSGMYLSPSRIQYPSPSKMREKNKNNKETTKHVLPRRNSRRRPLLSLSLSLSVGCSSRTYKETCGKITIKHSASFFPSILLPFPSTCLPTYSTTNAHFLSSLWKQMCNGTMQPKKRKERERESSKGETEREREREREGGGKVTDVRTTILHVL